VELKGFCLFINVDKLTWLERETVLDVASVDEEQKAFTTFSVGNTEK